MDNLSTTVSLTATLLCSTLIHISFTIYGEEDDDAIADTMQAVAEICPLLQEFCYSHIYRDTLAPLELESSLISIVRNCVHLRKVTIPASRMIVDALGHLSSLSTLKLGDSCWESRPLQQTDVLKTHQPWDQEVFAALESLAVRGGFSSACLVGLFRDAGCFPSMQFDIFIDESPGEDSNPLSSLELAEVLRLVLHPGPSSGLQNIHVTRWLSNRQAAQPQAALADSWQPFCYLLPLSHLQSVTIFGFFLDINDLDLEEVTQNWQELRSFRIFAPTVPTHPQSKITFQGLAHLSTLPKLRNLTVVLGSDCRIPPSLISQPTSSTSPLTTIEIQGEFPLVTTLQLTLFLVKYFPNLQKVTAYGRKLGAHPNEIETGLDFARQTLQAIHRPQSI